MKCNGSSGDTNAYGGLTYVHKPPIRMSTKLASVHYHRDHGYIVVVSVAKKKRRAVKKFDNRQQAERYAYGWNQLNRS